MGLDKRKNILVVDNFNFTAFDDINIKLSNDNKSSLPTQEADVMLDRHQGVHYSVQNVLNKLLDNDAFIQQYLLNINTFITDDVKNRLLSSIVSNINPSTISEATNSTTGIYTKFLNDHKNKYHNANGSDFCYLSSVSLNYLKNDMSNFDELGAKQNFQKIDDPNSNIFANAVNLSNDIVIDVEFDDSENVRNATNYIAVYVCNENTNNQFQTTMTKQLATLEQLPNLTQCKYIYKKWLSGFKELYIYIPTTFTEYHPHKDIDYGNEKPDEKATIIKVGINRRHFQFNHIYQANICGQSLPMQIYATEDSPYFSDVILPSMLRSLCITQKDANNNTDMILDQRTSMYYLYFTCYGTDAQAIRIYGD